MSHNRACVRDDRARRECAIPCKHGPFQEVLSMFAVVCHISGRWGVFSGSINAVHPPCCTACASQLMTYGLSSTCTTRTSHARTEVRRPPGDWLGMLRSTDGQPSRGRRCLPLPSHTRHTCVGADSIDESAPTITRMFGRAGGASRCTGDRGTHRTARPTPHTLHRGSPAATRPRWGAETQSRTFKPRFTSLDETEVPAEFLAFALTMYWPGIFIRPR